MAPRTLFDKVWAQLKREGRPVFFNNNGIHPGEPEGVDGCMALVRDFCVDPARLAALGQNLGGAGGEFDGAVVVAELVDAREHTAVLAVLQHATDGEDRHRDQPGEKARRQHAAQLANDLSWMQHVFQRHDVDARIKRR